MKITGTLILVAISLFANAQNVKTDTLKEVQIIGISVNKLEPITQSKINCGELGYLNQQKDPFFVLATATPSIYAQSDNGQENGYSYMRLRGLDQTRINFNLNGIPLNEMEDQGLYFSNIPGFYNYLSSVNVERGVGTSKYGNTSIAGSVDMETRNISEKTTEVSALIKSNYSNQFADNFFYSSGINTKGVAVQLGGTYMQNQGFKDNSGNDGGSIYYALESVKKYNIFKIYGVSGIAHNHLAFYGVPMGIIDSYYKTNLNLISDKDTFKQNMICLNWINFKNANAKFNTSLYFDNVNGSYNTGGILFGVKSYQVGMVTNIVIEDKNNILNIGANANIYSRKHFGSDNNGYYDYPQNCQYYSNVGHKEDIIGYIKGIRKNVEGTNLFYDLQARSVWFNASPSKTYNWLFLNPKFGLKTTGTVDNIYINAGLTQREPTRTDMLQNIIQSDSTYRYGNPDNTKFFQYDTVKLKPELVCDIEIGNNYHTNNIEANINAYAMYIRNEFVATGVIDPYSGFMMKKAVDLTLRNGIETNIKVKINHFNLLFNTQLQHNSLSYKSPTYTDKIPFAPSFIGSVGLSYNLKHIVFGLTEQTVSSMIMSLTDQTSISNPYTITNGFVDITKNKITLLLKVNNIFDNKYYIPAGMVSVPTYYVGQLINYTLTLKLKF